MFPYCMPRLRVAATVDTEREFVLAVVSDVTAMGPRNGILDACMYSILNFRCCWLGFVFAHGTSCAKLTTGCLKCDLKQHSR